MRYHLLAILLLACAMMGCKANEVRMPAAASADRPLATTQLQRTRNNSLSLLHEVLGDEQNVSKLLIIKRERSELHDLIKRISQESGAVVKRLETFAKTDRSIDLKRADLPPGERAARDAEAKMMTSQLLHSKGEEFEFHLLLCQAQAVGYARNLARVAASDEPDAARRKEMFAMSEQLEKLHQDVLKMLRKPAVITSRNNR